MKNKKALLIVIFIIAIMYISSFAFATQDTDAELSNINLIEISGLEEIDFVLPVTTYQMSGEDEGSGGGL